MFPSTGGDLCCQNITNIEELKEFDLDNHTEHNTNGCKIYDTRPNIFQVDKMFKLKYNKEFNKDEFYLINAQVCNTLQEQYGIDSNFEIKITKEI